MGRSPTTTAEAQTITWAATEDIPKDVATAVDHHRMATPLKASTTVNSTGTPAVNRDTEIRKTCLLCLPLKIHPSSVTPASKRHPPNPPTNLSPRAGAGGIVHPLDSRVTHVVVTLAASQAVLEQAPNGVLQQPRKPATLPGCTPTGSDRMAITTGSITLLGLTHNILPTQETRQPTPQVTTWGRRT